MLGPRARAPQHNTIASRERRKAARAAVNYQYNCQALRKVIRRARSLSAPAFRETGLPRQPVALGGAGENDHFQASAGRWRRMQISEGGCVWDRGYLLPRVCVGIEIGGIERLRGFAKLMEARSIFYRALRGCGTFLNTDNSSDPFFLLTARVCVNIFRNVVV